jgi:hypothetical protein
MHHTPTYASWLNQVERWFALLTDKKLRRGAHRSIQALQKDIRDWITNWDDDPKPFTWTKTADEILERLASYIQRIPGAGHCMQISLRLRRPLPVHPGFAQPCTWGSSQVASWLCRYPSRLTFVPRAPSRRWREGTAIGLPPPTRG